jgi:hypothetical protein
MNILVNRLVPSGLMPALATAVSLTSNDTEVQQPSSMPGEDVGISDRHFDGAATCANLVTIDQRAPAREGRQRITGP